MFPQMNKHIGDSFEAFNKQLDDFMDELVEWVTITSFSEYTNKMDEVGQNIGLVIVQC